MLKSCGRELQAVPQNKRVLIMASVLAASTAVSASASAAAGDLTDWFRARSQALFDAIAVGDRGIWDQTLDDNCIITTEDGEVLGKQKFLAQLRPLPAGYVGTGRIRDLTVRDLGTAEVVHYWIDEKERILDQELRTTYVETDTYRKVDASWRIMAAQVTVVPRDLEPIAVETNDWVALLGDYRVDQHLGYHVFEKDGTLLAGPDVHSATALIPLAPLTFFKQGSIHLLIFVKDASGQVVELREIHKYNEVRMTKVRSAPK